MGDHSQDVLVTTSTGGGTPQNSFILLNHDGNIRISAGASPGASEGITVLDGGNVNFSGNVSGSATSTGSFGAIRSIGLPLSVDSDHVGIGTTTPGSYYNSPLVTYAPSTNYLTIATNTNGISSILMADGTSGAQTYAAQLEYQHATDEWRFHGGGSRFMTVINSNVGIGDTNPGEKLSVTGNIKASANITGSNLLVTSTGSISSLKVDGASIDFTNVPTSDPGIAGRVWRDGTDLKISTG